MSDKKLGTSIIRNVALNYVFIDEPKSPFGTLQWECQIIGDASREEEFSNFGKVRKLDDGRVSVNLKRKAHKKDGEANSPVDYIDIHKKPIENRRNIGNGSTGNVKVWSCEYDVAGRSGVTTILSAIQMTNLIEYNGAVDFDDLSEEEGSDSSSDDEF